MSVLGGVLIELGGDRGGVAEPCLQFGGRRSNLGSNRGTGVAEVVICRLATSISDSQHLPTWTTDGMWS